MQFEDSNLMSWNITNLHNMLLSILCVRRESGLIDFAPFLSVSGSEEKH